jgi:hypothetical protein
MPLKFGNQSTTEEPKPTAPKPSFLLTGKAAIEELKKEESRIAESMSHSVWRFRIPKDSFGKDFTITFLDGDLDADGMLAVPTFYEHTVFVNGKWRNIVCIAGNEPCPLCEVNNSHYLVGVLTVIDHTPYTKKDGTVIKFQKKLFVAKQTTLKLLQKLATKRGGLAGCTFEVSRSSGKEPSVGNLFEFVQKDDLQALRDHFGKDANGNVIAEPFCYEEVIEYKDAKALAEIGIVSNLSTIGAGSSSGEEEEGGEVDDYTDQM